MAIPGRDDPRRRVGAVVPVFAPPPSLPEAVAETLAQVERLVLVVDEDLPEPETTTRVVSACEALGAVVVRQPRNTGIAAALNSGVAVLRTSLGADDVLLTLDQDSRLPGDFVKRMLSAFDTGAADDGQAGRRVGLVAPGAIPGIPMVAAGGRPGGRMVEPIQSGLMVLVSVWEHVGGLDESLFIDGVDTDFFLRCRARGYDCAVVGGLRIEHTLGRPTTVGLGPLALHLRVAAGFRYYYLTRNTLTIVRRHGLREPAWAIRTMVRLVRHLALSTLVRSGRRERWAMAALGLKDGIRGVGGRLPERGDRST